jgi:hypothetical protein
MSEQEAAKALGIDGVVWRITRGILRGAALDDGTLGVTRASVEAEIEWQQRATRWMRVRRAIGSLFYWL